MLVADIAKKPTVGSFPGDKLVFKDKLLFFADSTFNGWHGMWAYNDTIVTPLFSAKNPTSFGIANDKLFFGESNTGAGVELCISDGLNSPVMVQDIWPGPTGSSPSNFVTYNNKLYFQAYTTRGSTIWMHDPSSGITRNVSDSITGDYFTTVYDNKIFFCGYDPKGVTGVFYYDPALDIVKQTPSNDTSNFLDPSYINVCYDKLYFAAWSPGHGKELYVYDGKQPPVRLSDINPGPGYAFPLFNYNARQCMIGYKGAVYFTAAKDSLHPQLYKYNPNAPISVSNPSFVYNINAPIDASIQFIAYDNKLYFAGSDSLHGTELWMYDGIHDPMMVADINRGKTSSTPRSFAIYNNGLYFTASDSATGAELYLLGFPTGIIQVSKAAHVHVYPVPANSVLHFEIELKTGYSFALVLTDITGRSVYKSNMNQYPEGISLVEANVSQLIQGSYYYQIITKDGLILAAGKVEKE